MEMCLIGEAFRAFEVEWIYRKLRASMGKHLHSPALKSRPMQNICKMQMRNKSFNHPTYIITKYNILSQYTVD